MRAMNIQPPGTGKKTAPFVVKIGGSLLPQIASLVPCLQKSVHPLLIVPGGGPFADEVRAQIVCDDAAHWMAVAAMDQYGWVIASQGLPTVDQLAIPAKTAVLLPYCVMKRHDPLPHSWDITSDTIAAWVAKTLGTPLLVLKSVDGIMIHGVCREQITEPVASDSVDPCFIPYVIKNRIPVQIINGTRLDRIEQFLAGEPVYGTRIGTTF